MDGFDAGDHFTKWNSVTGSTNSSTATRYSVGRSIQFGGGTNYVIKYFAASAEVYVGFSAANVVVGATIAIFYVYTDAGTTAQLNLATNANGSMSIRRGGTTLATTVAGLVSSGWNYIEFHAKVDPTSGIAELKVNGQVAATFSGNTKNGGTSNNIDAIQATNSASVVWYMDDFYLLDGTGSAPYNTYLGDVRINTLSPNGAGSSTGFSPSSGANYTTVDEIPANSSDFVAASASGTRDTYAMQDITGSYNVLAVQNNIIAKRGDAGGTAIKSAIKSGASVFYGANNNLTASDVTYSDLRTVDPNTSSNWTVSSVNALEAGMEIV